MQKIKELRENKGLSQIKLGKIAELAQSTISEIESGRLDPSLRTLHKIATALGVSVADLLDDTQAAGLDKTGTE